jgi:hypothetical protein
VLPALSPGRIVDSNRTDNCYRDYAQTNAQDLMDLLAQIDADVDPPPPPKDPSASE